MEIFWPGTSSSKCSEHYFDFQCNSSALSSQFLSLESPSSVDLQQKRALFRGLFLLD